MFKQAGPPFVSMHPLPTFLLIILLCGFIIFTCESSVNKNNQTQNSEEKNLEGECKGPCEEADQNRAGSKPGSSLGEIQLFCQDERKIAITWSSNETEIDYFIEYRSQFNESWIQGKTVNKPMALITNLNRGGYVFRVTPWKRLGNVKGNSKESQTLYTLIHNGELSHISSANISHYKSFEKHLSAILTWQPVEEQVCGYSIVAWRVGHEYYEISPTIDELYKVELKHLLYSTKYEIIIQAITENFHGGKYRFEYVTPSCAELNDFDYNFCAPEKPSNFKVSIDNCVLNLSWEAPRKHPDLYFLQVHCLISGRENDFKISGERTNFSINISGFNEELQLHFYALANSKKGDEIITRLKNNNCSSEENNGLQKERNNGDVLIGNNSSELSLVAEIGLIALAVVLLITPLLIIFLLMYRFYSCTPTPDPETNGKVEDKNEIEKSPEIYMPIFGTDIKSSMLKIQEIVGKGEFGIVSKAILKTSQEDMEVAVKSLRKNATKEDEQCFKSEVEVMKTVGQHKNLVSYIGYCKQNKLLVVEYCALGDLQNFLREARKSRLMLREILTHPGDYEALVSQIPPSNIVSNVLYERTDLEKKFIELNITDLLTFSRQIATGMEYLSTNKIVHRDLAARNILLTADLTAKISDFGLSRDIYLESVYRKNKISKLPIKWMAPESFSHQLFTTQSDVWSFGILLWEIMTLGGAPYPSFPSGIIHKLLKSGYRMEKPPSCSQEVYEIMKICWEEVPYKRPSFTNIILLIDRVLNNESMHEYIDLDTEGINYAHVNAIDD